MTAGEHIRQFTIKPSAQVGVCLTADNPHKRQILKLD